MACPSGPAGYGSGHGPGAGSGANSWLGSGTSVTISDASGSRYSGAYADTCVFPFTLSEVPVGDDFYRVGVGNQAGTGVTFSDDQLRTSGASLSIGG